MTLRSHKIVKCECGVIISQCRCPSPDKTVETVRCTHGKPAAPATEPK